MMLFLKNKSLRVILALSLLGGTALYAQPAAFHESGGMIVLSEDLVLEPHVQADGKVNGLDLYVRKKDGVQSVMLTETTKDPLGKYDNYAYRAPEYNPVNGDEIRYLNGAPLKSEYGKYSLISSTVARHRTLGDSFRIYIPPVIEYGYPWTRNGSVRIGKGTFINIRTFEKKYCDYTGAFRDNPFMFDLAEADPPPPSPPLVLTDDYNSVAAQAFEDIARDGNGFLTYSKGPKSISDDLLRAMDAVNPKDKVDVVFAIDTTGSMKDDLDTIRNEWLPKFTEQLEKFGDVRMGLLLYRDYTDNYSFKGLPVKFFDFTRYVSQLGRCLDTVTIRGNEGGDVPEAVYEALFASLMYYDWRPDAQKKIILIGDAEPHPAPRGPKKITRDYVTALASEKGVVLDCIIVPDDKSERYR